MVKIILSILAVLWSFEAYGLVSFIDGEQGTSFSKQSYGCADGWHLSGSKCVKNVCSSTTYPFSIRPENGAGTIISCKSGNDTVYGYSACNNGWTMQSGNCTINTCTGYPYSTKPDTAAGTIISCKSGVNDLYAYSSCRTGWALAGGRCEPAACDGYPYSSKPDTSIGTVSSTTCKSGATTKYKYASCKTGWDLDNGSCVVHVCDNTVYLTTTCPTNATCAPCYTGGNIKYASPVCNSGYELSGGVCVDSCSYKLTYVPSKCATYDTCTKGGSTYYACTSCQGGNKSCYRAVDGDCVSQYDDEWSFQSITLTYGANSSHGCDSSKGTVRACTTSDTVTSDAAPWYTLDGYQYYECKSGHVCRKADFKCSYSSCNSGYTLDRGMCWCSGTYKYNGDSYYDYDGEGYISVSNFATSWNTCIDLTHHVNVTKWKTASWQDWGTLKNVHLEYYNDRLTGPINLFVDFCEANGGHLITKDEIVANKDALSTYAYNYRWLRRVNIPYNESEGERSSYLGYKTINTPTYKGMYMSDGSGQTLYEHSGYHFAYAGPLKNATNEFKHPFVASNDIIMVCVKN